MSSVIVPVCPHCGESLDTEKYSKFFELKDVNDLIPDKAKINVTRKQLANLMAKVYDRPLETILDELRYQDKVETDNLRSI
jgi:hypothetical protein